MSQFFPFQHKGGRRFVIVLTTYLDESLPDTKDPDVTIVAGWVSEVSRWEGFASLWQKALNEWGLDYFHMSECEGGYGPYKDWTPEQHTTRLNHLLDLIKDHVVMGIAVSIPSEAYDVAIPAKLKPRVNPYHIAALSCFTHVSGILRHETPEEVQTAFVYEKLAKGAGSVLEAYQGIKNNPKLKRELRVVSLAYQPKKPERSGGVEFLPLQAADILAYETMKDVVNRRAKTPRKRRYPLCQLEKTTDIRKAEYDANLLRDIWVPLLEEVFPEGPSR